MDVLITLSLGVVGLVSLALACWMNHKRTARLEREAMVRHLANVI